MKSVSANERGGVSGEKPAKVGIGRVLILLLAPVKVVSRISRIEDDASFCVSVVFRKIENSSIFIKHVTLLISVTQL